MTKRALLAMLISAAACGDDDGTPGPMPGTDASMLDGGAPDGSTAMDGSAGDGETPFDGSGGEGGTSDGGEPLDASSDGGMPPPAARMCACDFCWYNPVSGTIDINALWGSAPNHLLAALEFYAVLRWDGSSWSRDPIPNGHMPLTSISGSSADDVWLGSPRSIFPPGPGFNHWNGTEWAWVNLFVSFSGPTDVAAIAPGDAWGVVVGSPYRWNGTDWTGTMVPSSVGSIWAADATTAWAVGAAGAIARWNGTAWTAVTSPAATATLTDVWGASADDVWIAGELGGDLLHWNGSTVERVTTGATVSLTRVAGSAGTDVWALGGSTVASWNGTAWSVRTLPFEARGVWAFAPNDVWVGGAGGAHAHWDGSAWTDTSGVSHRQLLAASRSPGGTVWAVGAEGTVMTWDGARWTVQSAGVTTSLDGVWAASDSDVWAVGATARRWDGATWSNVAALDGLSGIWGSAPNDGWAVGAGGVVLRWNGTSWSAARGIRLRTNLLAVSGSGPTNVWIAGEAGTVAQWDGSTWTEHAPAPLTSRLVAVWTSGPTDVWVAGESIWHYDGTAWTERPFLERTSPVAALAGTGPADVWAITTGGTPAHWTGPRWIEPPAGTACALESMHALSMSADGADLWAFGDDGAILRYEPSP